MSPAERELFERDPFLHMRVAQFRDKLAAGWLWVERLTAGGDWVFYNLLLPGDEYEQHAALHRLRVRPDPF